MRNCFARTSVGDREMCSWGSECKPQEIGGRTANDGGVGSLLSRYSRCLLRLSLIALELSALKTWLARYVKESDCTVTDCGSHMKRVLTRSDGKAERDIVTINEEKGEVSFDVERVTVNPYRYEIYQRNISDKMRLVFGIRSVVAKDIMMSAGDTREGD